MRSEPPTVEDPSPEPEEVRTGPPDAETKALVLQLRDSSFLLTNPQGSISRWEPGAAGLFGWQADEVVGRPLLDTLVASAKGREPEDGEIESAWRRLFEEGEGPTPPSRLSAPANHRDGRELEVELTLVPIRLSQGLAFNRFLHDLGLNLPADLQLERVARQHAEVLRSISTTLEGTAGDQDTERLAGTIVAFRPLGDAPSVDEAVDPLEKALARAEQAARETEEAGLERDAALAEAAGAARAVEELRADGRRLRDEVEADNRRLREELEALRGALDARGAASEESSAGAEAAGRAAEQALAGADEVRGEAEATRAEVAEARRALDEIRAEAEKARRESAEARGKLEEVRTAAEQLMVGLEEARGTAAGAAAELEHTRGEAEQALRAARQAREAEEARRQTADARLRAIEARQVTANGNGLTVLLGNGEAPAPVPGPGRPARPAREGFDDADTAMAVIGLDGHFRELNPRFSEKVGYAEWEFRKAMWPSVSDRENLEEHRELMRGFSAGELDEASVETCYMHKQGLLVPVAGTLSLARDGDGEPLHILFTGAEPALARA